MPSTSDAGLGLENGSRSILGRDRAVDSGDDSGDKFMAGPSGTSHSSTNGPSSSTARPANASVQGLSTATASSTSSTSAIPSIGPSSKSIPPANIRDLKSGEFRKYLEEKANKSRKGGRAQPVPRRRPESAGSSVNQVPAAAASAPTGHADMDVDRESRVPLVDPGLPPVSVQLMEGIVPTMTIKNSAARSVFSTAPGQSTPSEDLISSITSAASRTVISQKRSSELSVRKITIRGMGNAVAGDVASPVEGLSAIRSATPTESTSPGVVASPGAGPSESTQPSGQSAGTNTVRDPKSTERNGPDPEPVEIVDTGSSPIRTPARSPSIEILDQDTYNQRLTPVKKRKLSTIPPEAASLTARLGSDLPNRSAQVTPDVAVQEVELLNGIEENAATTTLTEEDLAGVLAEDDTMAGLEDSDEVRVAEQLFSVPADQSPQWARTVSSEVNAMIQEQEGQSAAAQRSGHLAHGEASASTSMPSSTAATTKSVGPVIRLNVPSYYNKPVAANAVDKSSAPPPVFKAPYPVGINVKGKEPVGQREPFERKASPPIPQASASDRQELWKKQALNAKAGRLPQDVDSMLHIGHDEDDPFVAHQQVQNAVAGPSFKYPEVTENTSLHASPEPKPFQGMSKDFDYRKFDDPLLDCINSLPPHAQNPSHVRVILEAYYSQSSLDRAPPIKIHGGEYDEYPPAEFKYSDDVYYSEKVPKPWLGKGCECVGPCSENSDCFCLKRQEMYFASYITDAVAGPLKGFAYNNDGTLKDCQYPTWECGLQCDCPPACKNRIMQKGRSPEVQLEVYKTRKKGWGVRALSSFKKGTFVGLYSGELIPEEETDARGEIYNAIERTYLFDLDHWHIKQPPENLATIDPAGAYIAQQAAAILQEQDEKGALADQEGREVSTFSSFFTVDAFHWGFTRFFNHSCDPNLVLSAAYFDDFDIRKPRLAITAKRDVKKGDELCISYTGPPDDDGLPPMIETDEQLTARTGSKDNGKRGVVKKRKGGTAHKQKTTKTPEKLEKGRCQCGAKNCNGYMFNAYSGL